MSLPSGLESIRVGSGLGPLGVHIPNPCSSLGCADPTSAPPSSAAGLSNVTVTPLQSGLANPSSKLTLSVTATSQDPSSLTYSWHCPTDPTVLSTRHLLSSTSSTYLVLAKSTLRPWSVTSGRFRFTVTASDSYGNATSTVSIGVLYSPELLLLGVQAHKGPLTRSPGLGPCQPFPLQRDAEMQPLLGHGSPDHVRLQGQRVDR